jgi:YD repeat-containing protein
MKRLLISLSIPFWCLSSAFAAEITTRTHELYMGDLNGDGHLDYYVHNKPAYLLIHGDIIVPVLLPPDSFAIYRDGTSYSGPSPYALNQTQLKQRLDAKTLRAAQLDIDYFIWEDGPQRHKQMFVRGSDKTSPSFLVTSFTESDPVISQVFPVRAEANLSDRTIAIAFEDKNADGFMDIIIGQYVYLSAGGYVISESPTPLNQAVSVTTTYEYDALGRVKKVGDPENGNRDYAYDDAGNRIAVGVNNTAPVAQDDAVRLSGLYTPSTVNVFQNDSDPDGDTLSITSIVAPSTLSVTDKGAGNLEVVAVGYKISSQTFTYTISDGKGGSDEATVMVSTW